MIVSPSFELPFRAMPPISQTADAASHRKIGGTVYRGNRGFLLTREASAYGRGREDCTKGVKRLKEISRSLTKLKTGHEMRNTRPLVERGTDQQRQSSENVRNEEAKGHSESARSRAINVAISEEKRRQGNQSGAQ